MTRWMTLGCAAVVVCGHAAWAHAQTATAVTPAPAAAAAAATGTQDNRMVLADNESFLMPLDDMKNVHPGYPENLLGLNLPPRTVCLRVGIDEKGAVTVVARAPTSEFCPKGAEPEFLAASETAARTWKFDPALRCVFRNTKDKDRAVASCDGGKGIPQAVTLVYRFRFEQVNGKPNVHVIGG
ncbi:hypothetical protein MNR01_07365 [Lysobacter sp. S4-A87]|uniref:hypothetical protein n=1 Tax=Lysobacter sp. S4-A87 TaxID=2925843 RepID=UPI001F532676|nr:hypothetical protein [Lysobacter sp. S4-A87]UNK50813.1 hypothetical protein MNR01_07365 [Lysobacter sp. S4-A87]